MSNIAYNNTQSYDTIMPTNTISIPPTSQFCYVDPYTGHIYYTTTGTQTYQPDPDWQLRKEIQELREEVRSLRDTILPMLHNLSHNKQDDAKVRRHHDEGSGRPDSLSEGTGGTLSEGGESPHYPTPKGDWLWRG